MGNHLKQFIFVIITILIWNNAISQIGVQISYIKPAGTYGYVFKPTLGLEFNKEFSEREDNFRLGLSVGVFHLATRMDTFPTYAIMYSSSTTLLPGYEIYKNYFSIPVGLNIEWKLGKKKLSPIIGTDVYLHFIFYKHWHFTTNLAEEYDSGGTFSIGLVPRVGVLYKINEKYSLSMGIGKCMSINEERSILSYWKIFCKLHYYI